MAKTLHAKFKHMVNYLCKKFSSIT